MNIHQSIGVAQQMPVWNRHRIRKWSPTQANLWISSPGLYVRQYIGRVKAEEQPSWWRGNAVEDGWKALLHGADMAMALSFAHVTFNRRVDENRPPALRNTDDILKEAKLIEPMLVQASKWEGVPRERPGTQLRAEMFLDGLYIPIEGYVDFAFSEAQLDVDCKSSKQITNEIPDNHAIQIAIYRKARKRRGGLLYVTHAKHNFLELSDERMEQALVDLRRAAMSLYKFLAGCPAREDAIERLPVDYGHWTKPARMSTEEVIAHMRRYDDERQAS